MDSLDFLNDETKELGTIVESVDEMHPLDWDRLRDANDDYDSILITPNGKL